ncbi:MAG: Uma2 family endonuclease [Spirochaetaceae bacterium]
MTPQTRHRTKLTYEDYVHFPDDGNRHEIIDGEHYMSPSPTTAHQDASRHIQFQLYRDIEEKGLGRVYNAPMDLQLSDTDVVQPDLMVILAEHRHYVSPSRLLGPPDLVVEILSPATAERDRSLKLKLYEQRGVPEYWLVDLDAHSVSRYRIGAAGYELTETCEREIVYTAPAAESRSEDVTARVDLRKVW